MEWVLQVADEVDDVFGVLLHGWLGFYAEMGGGLMWASGAVLPKLRGTRAAPRTA
jgi:hypothetical protein